MRYKQICSNSFINFLNAVTLFTSSSLSSKKFQTPRNSCKVTHAYCSNCEVIMFFFVLICFETVIMLIRDDSLIHPRFVLLISFENVVWQVAGGHYKYFFFQGKDNCRRKCFHDGSTRETKRSFFQRNGRLGARWGNKSETFLQAVGRAELKNF